MGPSPERSLPSRGIRIREVGGPPGTGSPHRRELEQLHSVGGAASEPLRLLYVIGHTVAAPSVVTSMTFPMIVISGQVRIGRDSSGGVNWRTVNP